MRVKVNQIFIMLSLFFSKHQQDGKAPHHCYHKQHTKFHIRFFPNLNIFLLLEFPHHIKLLVCFGGFSMLHEYITGWMETAVPYEFKRICCVLCAMYLYLSVYEKQCSPTRMLLWMKVEGYKTTKLNKKTIKSAWSANSKRIRWAWT